MQESGEMYLEAILQLKMKNEKVRSIDIAEFMNFSKPAISRAVNILKDERYIIIDENGYIDFTESGKILAEKIYERHILLTDFLISIGVTKEVAQLDACKIEHDISDETFNKLKEYFKQ